MAIKPMRLCDSCGKLEAANIEVKALDAKVSDGTRIVGDLCNSCLSTMVKSYGLTTTAKRRRTTYQVKTLEEIVPDKAEKRGAQ